MKFFMVGTKNEIYRKTSSILSNSSYSTFMIINEFCEYYKMQCLKNNIDYVQLITTDPLDKSLMQYLIKRAQIAK